MGTITMGILLIVIGILCIVTAYVILSGESVRLSHMLMFAGHVGPAIHNISDVEKKKYHVKRAAKNEMIMGDIFIGLGLVNFLLPFQPLIFFMFLMIVPIFFALLTKVQLKQINPRVK